MHSLIKSSYRTQKCESKHTVNSHSIGKKYFPNCTYVKESKSNNDKNAYMKRFFQRRNQIQMEVRTKVFREAQQRMKAEERKEFIQSSGFKHRNLNKLSKQGVSQERQQKEKCSNQNQNYGNIRQNNNNSHQYSQQQEVSNKNNLLSSWQATTKTTKECQKTYINRENFDFHIDLKSILSKKRSQLKLCRDPCSDKRIHHCQESPNKMESIIDEHFNYFNQKKQKNKSNTNSQSSFRNFQMLTKNCSALNNPESPKVVEKSKMINNEEMGKKKQRMIREFVPSKEKTFIKVPSLRRKMEQNQKKKYNNFKYQMNSQLRQKLEEMLTKQRKTDIENDYQLQRNEKLQNKKQNMFPSLIQVLYVPSLSKQENIEELFKQQKNSLCFDFNQCNSINVRKQRSSIQMELRKEREKQDRLKMIQKIAITSQYSSSNEMIHDHENNNNQNIVELLDKGNKQQCGSCGYLQSCYKQMKQQQQQMKDHKQQLSQIICAICQTNITHKFWEFAIFYNKNNQEQQQQQQWSNLNQLFIEKQRYSYVKQQEAECHEQQIPLLLDCGHSYHKVCLEQWFKYKTFCPLCKADNNPDNSHINIEVDNTSWEMEDEYYDDADEDEGSLSLSDYEERFIPNVALFRLMRNINNQDHTIHQANNNSNVNNSRGNVHLHLITSSGEGEQQHNTIPIPFSHINSAENEHTNSTSIIASANHQRSYIHNIILNTDDEIGNGSINSGMQNGDDYDDYEFEVSF